MNKLTPQIKKDITKDWNILFSDMVAYKPMWLMKRCSAIVLGIALDRDSANDNYRPIAFMHNLCISFPVIALGVPQQLRTRNGSEERIPVIAHTERYKDAAERLHNQSMIPLRKALNFDDIIKIYQNSIKLNIRNNDSSMYTPYNYQGFLLMNAWRGMPYAENKKNLDQFREQLLMWSYKFFDIESWYEKMNSLIQDRPKIIQTVNEEIIKHKLEKVPNYPVEIK